MEGGLHGRMNINHAQEVVEGAYNSDNAIAVYQGWLIHLRCIGETVWNIKLTTPVLLFSDQATEESFVRETREVTDYVIYRLVL